MRWQISTAICFLIITSLASVIPRAEAKPAPGVSGLLSIVPGLGQVANGDVLEGGGWFITTIGLYFSGNKILSQFGYDIWQYNMYDAYRDTGPHNHANNNVFANYVATFNPANIADPIGAPIFGLGAALGSKNKYAGIRNPTYIPYYAIVGMGEEGLFRGFLFPALSEWVGTFPGAVVSSALFSLFHITNGKGALGVAPLTQRFVMGLLFSWQTHRNRYDLRKSIFAHSWWDVFVGPSTPADVKADGFTIGTRFHF